MLEFKHTHNIVTVDKHNTAMILTIKSSAYDISTITDHIKAAVHEYMQTQAGRTRYEQNGHSFNWSDVISLPDDICANHSFKIQNVFATGNYHNMEEELYTD